MMKILEYPGVLGVVRSNSRCWSVKLSASPGHERGPGPWSEQRVKKSCLSPAGRRFRGKFIRNRQASHVAVINHRSVSARKWRIAEGWAGLGMKLDSQQSKPFPAFVDCWLCFWHSLLFRIHRNILLAGFDSLGFCLFDEYGIYYGRGHDDSVNQRVQ